MSNDENTIYTNERYEKYKKILEELFNIPPKIKVEDIKYDIIHNDVYNITSENDIEKGIALFRVGNKLAILPKKEMSAERCFKQSIDILTKVGNKKDDNTISKIIEDSHVNLINLYLEKNKFDDAEKYIDIYLNIIEENYKDKSDNIGMNMEYNRKIAIGLKLWMKLLWKSDKKDEAEKVYGSLLNRSGIRLTRKEYDLCLRNNCVKNGTFIQCINGNLNEISDIRGDEGLIERQNELIKKRMDNFIIEL